MLILVTILKCSASAHECIQLRNFRAGHDCRGAAQLLLNSGVYSRMTSDFAREFYDLLPPSLGPHPSNSRSSHVADSSISSRIHDTEANSKMSHPVTHRDRPLTILSPTKAKVASNLSESSILSPSKKASAARQRYVGLASARSPLTSRNRFDIGLDSPGTPPLLQLPSRSHTSPVAHVPAKPSNKHSLPDGGQTRIRARLVDLDSRLLQVCFTHSFSDFEFISYDILLSLKLILKELLQMNIPTSSRGYTIFQKHHFELLFVFIDETFTRLTGAMSSSRCR